MKGLKAWGSGGVRGNLFGGGERPSCLLLPAPAPKPPPPRMVSPGRTGPRRRRRYRRQLKSARERREVQQRVAGGREGV